MVKSIHLSATPVNLCDTLNPKKSTQYERTMMANSSAFLRYLTTRTSSAARRSFSDLVRHGEGDSVVTLSVGGTEFHTLRSTIAANPILAGHVARAEANQNLTKDGAVFIDRDPKHFPIILQFLRNSVEKNKRNDTAGCETSESLSKQLKKYKYSSVSLPKDTTSLQELYMEASYFQMKELQDTLCHTSIVANVMSFFSGRGSNPFTEMTNLFGRLRAAILALGTAGTVAITSLQNVNFTSVPQSISPKEGSSSKPAGA
jgi:hypothetical protein